MPGTISFGTEVSGPGNSQSFTGSVVALSATKALAVHAEFNAGFTTGDLVATVIDISGTVPTVAGTGYAIDAAIDQPDETAFGLVANNSTEACVAYLVEDSGGLFALKAVVLSVSGTVVTVNTILTIYGTDVKSTAGITIDKLEADKYICVLANGNTKDTEAFVITQSGTTLTDQAKLNLDSASFNGIGYVAALSSTRVICQYAIGAPVTDVKVALLSVSGNTVSFVDDASLEANARLGGNDHLMVKLSSTQVVLFYTRASGGTERLIILEDGTSTINLGTPLSITNNNTECGLAKVGASTFIFAEQTDVDFQTYSVSGTTITADGNEASWPGVTDLCTLAELTTNKWVAVGEDSPTDELETYIVELTDDAYAYTHSSAGIPGSII